MSGGEAGLGGSPQHSPQHNRNITNWRTIFKSPIGGRSKGGRTFFDGSFSHSCSTSINSDGNQGIEKQESTHQTTGIRQWGIKESFKKTTGHAGHVPADRPSLPGPFHTWPSTFSKGEAGHPTRGVASKTLGCSSQWETGNAPVYGKKNRAVKRSNGYAIENVFSSNRGDSVSMFQLRQKERTFANKE